MEVLCEQQTQAPSPRFYQSIQAPILIYHDEAKPNPPEINSW